MDLLADRARIAALLLAVAAALFLPTMLRSARGRRLIQIACPAAAAALSAAYVVVYLRGGPRIIDATAYWLQAKALSQGMLAIPLPPDMPEHAILGRFLVRAADAHAVSVIFPPGYPAVLALGFLIGAPLAIGPAIAALLVIATMALTRSLARLLGLDGAARETLVATAALLSTCCAALRYHTADTMSHGAAALWITVALAALLRARAAVATSERRITMAAAGLALGMCFATRPVSALALFGVLGALAWAGRRDAFVRDGVAWIAAAVAALPALGLWLAHQHAATGSWLDTAQSAYYAASDGPPGCFRYGFGAGIGCLGEHGDFVRHNLPDGYGAWAALATTGRRLMMHTSDALGLFPLTALWLIGGWHGRRAPLFLAVAALVPCFIAAYAPFYFDGNYPGGGARMFADVLPIEHALAAVGIHALAARLPRLAPRLGGFTIALGALGFALHLGARHAELRDREGGRPMFSPAAARTPGLIFVDTDHGLNLGLAWALGRSDRQVVRFKGDALDGIALAASGRRDAWRYVHPDAVLVRYLPEHGPELAIEGESLWPPSALDGAWAWPSYVPLPCASRGRVLAIYPASSAPARVVLTVPGTAVSLHLANLDSREITVFSGINGDEAATETRIAPQRCAELAPLDLPRGRLWLRADGAFGVDRLIARQNR